MRFPKAALGRKFGSTGNDGTCDHRWLWKRTPDQLNMGGTRNNCNDPFCHPSPISADGSAQMAWLWSTFIGPTGEVMAIGQACAL